MDTPVQHQRSSIKHHNPLVNPPHAGQIAIYQLAAPRIFGRSIIQPVSRRQTDTPTFNKPGCRNSPRNRPQNPGIPRENPPPHNRPRNHSYNDAHNAHNQPNQFQPRPPSLRESNISASPKHPAPPRLPPCRFQIPTQKQLTDIGGAS